MALNKVTYVDDQTVITAENLNDIQDAIIALENAPAQGLTEDMKQALLQLARKLAYIDDQGQTYYDDLYDALYPPKTVVLITADFNQGSTVIYDDTALDDLKQYLTVTAKYDDNTTAILADSAYTLSGLLEAGTSTVTVAYNGLTTTFTVNVTARPTLSSITAVYTQSGTVYDTDTLDSLKADLVVTAHYSDSSTQTVPAADYTLSGTLETGTSTITVSYGGKTTTFQVAVVYIPNEYQQVEWIGASGTQYINTGIVPGHNPTLDIVYESGKSAGDVFQTLAGSTNQQDNSKYSSWREAIFSANTTINCTISPANSAASADVSSTTVTAPNATYVNSKLLYHASEFEFTVGEYTGVRSGVFVNAVCVYPLYIFAENINGTATNLSVGKLYSAKYSDGQGNAFDYVPCYRIADGVIGVFDKVSKQFLQNSGSGSFTKGPNSIAVTSISAVYTQSGTVYDTDSLYSLKSDLVVTATYADSSTATVSAYDYTLSGTLTAGTSTITVSYGGKTTTFNVTVTSTYLFSVADRAMTVSDSIDTGVDLISTDRDFSICLDIAITQFNGQPKIYYQFENASPWRGLVFGHGASDSFNCKYINSYEVISRAASSLTKVKAVISHTSGSGEALCYYRFNEETSTSSVTVNNAFVSLNPNSNLMIGVHTTNTWAGTINRFDIHSVAFTQAQAESFITGE